MKIGQLTHDSFFPNICGNAGVNYGYHQVFKKIADESILILYNKREEDYTFEDIKVVVSNPPKDSYAKTMEKYREEVAKAIGRTVRENKIDILFINDHDTGDRSSPYVLMHKYIPSNVIKIAIQHGYYNTFGSVKGLYHGVCVFGEYQREAYLRDGVAEDKIVVAPPPLKFSEIEKPLHERKKNAVLYIGRLSAGKEPHQLIPYLKEAGIEEYAIVASKSKKCPKYLDRLLNMAKNYGVFDRINFVGELPYKEIIDFAQDYRFCVQTSRSECFSLSIRDAIAAGCICVARENEIKEGYSWIDKYIHTVVGYSQMSKCIKDLNSAPVSELQLRSDSARDYIKNYMSEEVVYKKITELLENIL